MENEHFNNSKKPWPMLVLLCAIVLMIYSG